MKNYDHAAIEKKWQDEWTRSGLYRTKDDVATPKHYILDMFPYPSGEGLHVGHPRGYLATDVYSRMKRMQGFDVLHPMGWDAFGLPAENFAIKHGIHPRIAVDKNIARFKEQLSIMGPDYDWSKEINTTDPAYYKWTQWIFLQMYKKGLAYQSYEPINWCPGCQTGLANEDVEADGTCERCSSKIERKPMRQWVLKITDYADRMLVDLDKLPRWPEGVKEAQRHWIGRKEGITIAHAVENSALTIETFSAYPAWLFADTFIVIAPEHPQVPALIKEAENKQEIIAFIDQVKNTSEIERGAVNKEKIGIFTGRYAIDPINKGNKMPIWIANFAMMGFGTGIIRCSAHDIRDYAFAKKYGIPTKEVVERFNGEPVNAHSNKGVLVDSGVFTGRMIDETLIAEMTDWFVKEGYGKRTVTYRIKDWVFSRQRYWGEPIPIIHCQSCGAVAVPESQLPVLLPEVERYQPTGTGDSPLSMIDAWVNTTCPTCGGPAKRETNTMPQWAGSSWYYLRFIDPKNEHTLIDGEKERRWMPVDVYVGGDHATRHLIYARFWHKFLYDSGIVHTEEPFPRLEFLGYILAEDGRKMSKRWGNVVNPDDVIKKFGADAFRLYEMFIGPFESTVPWNTNGLVGTYRFLERVWKISQRGEYGTDDKNVDLLLHRTIKKVSEDIEQFKFNTAVSALMILLNETSNTPSKETFKIFLRLLAPFAPHITEEIWREVGEEQSIHRCPWPLWDPQKIQEENVTIAVQINGKVRSVLTVSANLTVEEIERMALDLPKIKESLRGSVPKKVVVVPGKIVNIVL